MIVNSPSYRTYAQPAAPRSTSGGNPRDSVVIDKQGGALGGFLGFMLSAGANSMVDLGFSPALAWGGLAFIGGSLGEGMARNLGTNRLVGTALGAGVGVGLAAAGIFGGWPGALGAGVACAVLRGVVLPTIAARS